MRRVVQVLAAIMLLWLGVFLGLNDRRLGRLVTKVVTGNVRGQFNLGYAHYSYWSSLASLLLNIPVPVEGRDFEMIDPNGGTVIRAKQVKATMYIGELVRGLLRTALSAPFGRGSFIELHFSSGHLPGAEAHIRPIKIKKLYPKGVTGPEFGNEVNIVATMAGKTPKPEDAPPGPGHVRITIDGAGVDFENVTYQMTFPGWHGQVEGLRGNVTLRMSTDAAENRPGYLAFSYEVAPLTAERGVLVLGGTTETDPGAFVFPLADLNLRRFGARPSNRQDLAFRGQLKAAGSPVEIDGKLLDKYCDTGVQLDLSFEQGNGLIKMVPGKMLGGQPRGRVHFFGPLSSTLPTTPSGKRNPCLADPGHTKRFPDEPEGRTVVIDGQLADAEAEVASIAVKGAGSRFQLKAGELHLPQVIGQALGGEVRVEPLHISFSGDMPWYARVAVNSGDPAQIGLMPEVLRPLVTGRMRGGVRASGTLKVQPERILLTGADATLERQGRRDPLPKELRLGGSFTYTPDLLTWRNLHINGETLALLADRGGVGPKSTQVDVPEVVMRGKGGPLQRVLAFFGVTSGVSGATSEAEARFRLGGRVLRPEVPQGSLTVSDLDLFGRRFESARTGFGLHDGRLRLADLLLRGPAGEVASRRAELQLFERDVTQRPADPSLFVDGSVKELRLDALVPGLPLTGALSGTASLNGTLLRPVGQIKADVPVLSVEDSKLTGLRGSAVFTRDSVTVDALSALLGDGRIEGRGQLMWERGRPLSTEVVLRHLPIEQLPRVKGLPVIVQGLLDGKLTLRGQTDPLVPSLEGSLRLPQLVVRGRPTGRVPGSEPLDSDPEPMLALFGMVIRSLTFGHSSLDFKPLVGGTHVEGRLLDAIDVRGDVLWQEGRPRGELVLRFGCPVPARFVVGSDGGAARQVPTAQSCDVAVERLVPQLSQLGNVQLYGSGEVKIRFGEDPRPLFWPRDAVTQSGGCPMLASRVTGGGHGYPLGIVVRLSRAIFNVRTVDDEGQDMRYVAHNDGDVLLCSDGRELEFGQARFASQRLRDRTEPAPEGTSPRPSAESHHSAESGTAQIRGLLGAVDSDLLVQGQIRLELLEHSLRSAFRHVHGEGQVRVRVTGPLDNPVLTGQVDLLGNTQVFPHELDMPIEIRKGQIRLAQGLIQLTNLELAADDAVMNLGGRIKVERWRPPVFSDIDFTLRGKLSARLLQWQLSRNLAEARGALEVPAGEVVHVTGSFARPIVEGTLLTRGLFLNLRRFHELQFYGGAVRFQRSGTSGDDGVILLGRNVGGSAGPLTGTVDGDGKITMSGRIEHTGLGDFMKSAWYKALDSVRIAITMDNVRHSSAGIYSLEMSTQNLQLLGNRDDMHLAGEVEVVSGRYSQDYDPADRLLSARRVVEEEKPFWDGDPFLSSLRLGLRVSTRGTFRVLNNIADLRLSTKNFALSGALEDIRMGGVIRVDSGSFYVPGLRGEFQVKPDSTISFSDQARWPETPYVDVRGGTRDFDQNDQQRNIELALRGRVSELKVECISSDGMSSADCASFLVLGGDLNESLRGGRTQVTPSPATTATGSGARAIEYGDPAAKLVTSRLLTDQVADPLREKLRLDTVRIQFGVSTFDLQLCKRFGLYLRMCGLAEWGILGNAAARYRAFGELQISDLTVGQASVERIERGFSFLEDTINRFKLQAGVRLPLRY